MSVLNKTLDKNIDIEVSKWFISRRDAPEVTDCFEGWWPPSPYEMSVALLPINATEINFSKRINRCKFKFLDRYS